MPCYHVFHQACILSWLEKDNLCPVCQYELPTDSKEYEMYRKEKQAAEKRRRGMFLCLRRKYITFSYQKYKRTQI
ncbi:RING finger protein 181 [Camponotus floridanus]|uniref:RING finger protein 181 n=1 Tax=Camponotus floridanus TaxID=104421 RepID=E2ABQ2_CAMFO|nr:RING finger protein 181 [Camponotus floridanus]